MANIVIKPASGTLEFNTGVVAGSAVDTTLSGASRLTFDSGELNLVSYATGNLNRFTIDGSTSRLFSAYDQMSGSLMSINTIAGFPVFEAFSDNTIVLGKYGSKDFVSTGNKIGIGTAAPANKLEVFGTGDVSVRITTTGSAAATDFAALRFFQGGVQKGSVIANSGVLRIGAGDGIGASSGVYVNSAGRVGVGSSNPGNALDIRNALPVIHFDRNSSYSWRLGTNDGSTYSGATSDFGLWDNSNVSRLHILASNGNVGIGTTDPSGKLSVMGPVSFGTNFETVIGSSGLNNSAQRVNLYYNGTLTRYNIVGIANVSLGLGTNGVADKVVIDTNGNVGIGLTTPSAKLEISGGNIQLGNTYGIYSRLTNGTAVGILSYNSSNLTRVGANGEIELGGYVAFKPTGAERMRIMADGNVGIGTTAPTNNLEILGVGTEASPTTLSINAPNSTTAGDSRIVLSQNTSLGDFQLLYAGTNARNDSRTSNNAYIEQSQAINIRTQSNSAGFSSQILVGLGSTTPGIGFSTNATGSLAIERMRIDSSGNVGIGTTTPTQKLDLYGTLRISSAGTYSDPASENAGFINYNTVDGILTLSARSNGGNTFMAFRTSDAGAASEKMRITNNGNIGIGTKIPVAKLTVIATGQAFDGTNAMVAYFGRDTLSGYGSTFIRVATVQNTTGIAGNLDYTDIEHNSLGTGPFRYGTYGDTNIINGVARTDGIYGSINFVTSGSVKMTIAGGTGNGYVGIGTTTPASRLSLATHNAPSGGITFGTDTNLYRSSAGVLKTDGALVVVNSVFIPNNAGVANGSTSNNAFLRMNTDGALITRDIGSSDANPALIVQQVNSGSLGDILQLKNDASTVLTVQRVGNVGIGTAAPTGKLEVFGTGDVGVRITTSGNDATTDFAALRFFQGGAQKGSVIANNSVLRLSAGTNLSGIFISDSGNVGINSIPTGANNVRFQVNGGVGSGIAALRFENCGISGAGSLGIGGKTFNGWLPIQIDSSTTRYIPLYA